MGRIVVVLSALAIGVLFWRLKHFLDVASITRLGDWVLSFGTFVGPLVFAALFALATPLMLPNTMLTLMGGVLFAPLPLWVACAASTAGSTVGAVAAFLLGRYVLQNSVREWLASQPLFRGVDRALAAPGLRSFMLLLLLRISPVIPGGVFNYALGLTRVSLLPYALSALLGRLPLLVLWTYVGRSAGSLAEALSGGSKAGGNMSLYLSLGGTVVAMVALGSFGRSMLRAALDEEAKAEEKAAAKAERKAEQRRQLGDGANKPSKKKSAAGSGSGSGSSASADSGGADDKNVAGKTELSQRRGKGAAQ